MLTRAVVLDRLRHLDPRRRAPERGAIAEHVVQPVEGEDQVVEIGHHSLRRRSWMITKSARRAR
ncbi:hypothetical protein [Microbacterium lacticum]